jgi:Rod binding domain-containing protein
MDLGGAVGGAGGPAAGASPAAEGRPSAGGREQNLRQRYLTGRPAPSARRNQNSQLSPQEQTEKLKKIRKSAIEYDSVFVDQLVKQMRPKPVTETPGSETFSEIAEQPFRNFLSQAGGLGLADSIVGQVARQEGLEQTLQEHPEIMGPNWRPTVPSNLMKKPVLGLEIAPNPGEETVSGETASVRDLGASRSGASAAALPGRKIGDGVGLMTAEEISYLYRDATDGYGSGKV